MAKVEDIYKKIRRGDTADLKYARPSDEELAQGVERIRSRLADSQKNIVRPSKASAWFWALPAAIAALAILTLLFFPRQKPVPIFEGFAAGSNHHFGSVEVRVLTAVTLGHDFLQGKLSLRLSQGAIAVRRSNADTALVIETPGGVLRAEGTAFIIEHDKITSIEISEGKITWQHGSETQRLDATHPRLGKDLGRLHRFLPAGYMKYPAALKPAARVVNTGFQKKDCVMYLSNGSRRQGIIREIVNGKYLLSHDGADEPDLFSGEDLISCDRTRPVFGSSHKPVTP